MTNIKSNFPRMKKQNKKIIIYKSKFMKKISRLKVTRMIFIIKNNFFLKEIKKN